MEKEQGIFRKKIIDRISSPERLTEYLQVTNPGIWLVLLITILLLAGIFVWSAIGILETGTDVAVVVQDHAAVVVSSGGVDIASGMPLRIAGQEYVIAFTKKDEYGRVSGFAEVNLPDGTYEATLVVEQVNPISFLLSGR